MTCLAFCSIHSSLHASNTHNTTRTIPWMTYVRFVALDCLSKWPASFSTNLYHSILSYHWSTTSAISNLLVVNEPCMTNWYVYTIDLHGVCCTLLDSQTNKNALEVGKLADKCVFEKMWKTHAIRLTVFQLFNQCFKSLQELTAHFHTESKLLKSNNVLFVLW